MLGVNFEFRRTGQLGIDYHGRNVSLVISHVGVSYESIFKIVTTPKFRRLMKSVRKSKRIIFASIDTLSHIAGLKEKFLAYQKFLQADPSHSKTCKLIQYLDPISYGKQYTTAEYNKVIMKIKDDIVEEFGSQVITIKMEALSEYKRLLLWANTDVLLNTTLRGGLRLPSLEYIAVRCILGKEGKSLIILSEFAGGIRALSGVLRCNPYSTKNTATVLERGYNISSKERARKMRNMLKYVMKHSTKSWANQFLRDIKVAHHQLECSLFMGLTSTAVKHRLIHQSNTKALNSSEFLDAYSNSCNRLIIIDTKGIVGQKSKRNIENYAFNSSELSQTIVRLLDSLSRFEENKIWIISPDTRDKITAKLSSIERYQNADKHNTGMSSN